MRVEEVVTEAKRQVSAITGHRAETVTGISRDGDGWILTVEALEVERVPDTMDLLGSYEVTFSDDGELRELRRRRRYQRGAVDNEEG